MGGMLCLIFVKYDYIVDDAPVFLETNKGFIDTLVVMFGNGGHSVWSLEKLKPAKGHSEGDE